MFITFEGGEGSGKTTQATLLATALRTAGHAVHLTREPGGCPAAEAVRQLLFASHQTFTLTAELLLMAAARAEHVTRTIRPALARREVVICDRFSDSTYVYQGCGGGLDAALIAAVDAVATGGLVPDLTLLLDLDPAAGLHRIATTGRSTNRFDTRPLAFHATIRDGFLQRAAKAPERIVVVDASQTAEGVMAAIWQAVQARMVL
jgi:dTMP kinase